MFLSILEKEYVKTRIGMLLLLAFGASCILWIGLGVHRLFMLDHPEIVWYHTLDLKQIPYRAFTYLPCVSALAFCFCQFLPEIRDERLRISLHLPCPLWALIFAHICFGLFFLIALFALEVTALLCILARFYPVEALTAAFWTLLPWCLAGIYSYLCCAWVLLEPRKRSRLLGLLLGVCVSVPLLMHWPPAAFRTATVPFLLGIPLLTISLFLPALHFRTREADQ